jgi:3-oxoacyl-[acyl-carrier-protein] synthase I
MTAPLLIASCGAVTAVGLTAEQTCAAMRARVAGFEASMYLPPPARPVTVARVPAAQRLKLQPSRWLLSMAELALRDCLGGFAARPGRIALVLSVPDPHRQHAALRSLTATGLLDSLQQRLQMRFHPLSCVTDEGHAAVIKGFALARQILAGGEVDLCVVGGVDSLVNGDDVERLQRADRLHGETNPQGVIPGEGAGFVGLSMRGSATGTGPLAQILGIGIALERDTILGERFSTGVGLREALENAVRDARCSEPDFSFRSSDANGERYRAWESLLCATRFYRSPRVQMPMWSVAASVGDVGAAAGALAVIAAAMGISRGYAPGRYAMCEASSDNGLRAACALASAPGAPAPPFRSRAALLQ